MDERESVGVGVICRAIPYRYGRDYGCHGKVFMRRLRPERQGILEIRRGGRILADRAPILLTAYIKSEKEKQRKRIERNKNERTEKNDIRTNEEIDTTGEL